MSGKKKADVNNFKVILAYTLLFISVILFTSFISYMFNWRVDQSNVGSLLDRNIEVENILGKIGASISHFFIYDLFGISSFIFPLILLVSSYYLLFNKKILDLIKKINWLLILIIWTTLLSGYLGNYFPIQSGIVGFEINAFLETYIGSIGILLIITFIFILSIAILWNITPSSILILLNSIKPSKKLEEKPLKGMLEDNILYEEDLKVTVDPKLNEEDEVKLESTINDDNVSMEVKEINFEEKSTKNISFNKVDLKKFDPTLDLSNFKNPSIDILKDYGDGTIKIDQDELETNKNKIVDTLKNYNIGIKQIKATIGPTVTLYEIIPNAGVRISKIKNLEDDIALSLSALGIRIIAPIPGKGTIGIEVPNKKKSIVSMKSLLSSKKYIESEMELPIAIGKTISNETFIVDLTKMPHLLMAGATGQGKSVGINAIITSILYKKHPAQVKFVLVDPKKIELSIYNKIERHYLAKLPESEDAIITDNDKVINTLNSLCMEMDKRYELLKDAMTRNIKEYNTKFISRKLNPENGHTFLPYIVLVIDEFADLIMTAGKEVETPLARLAQLSRAVGIHLIIATQRPSVNVITGLIKANFPARIAFRVTSKIDSRTILDTGGAEQLIGRGDLLYSQSNDLTRIQCGFIDTPEVDKLSDFIGSQMGYPTAYELPEYSKEDGGQSSDISIEDRDLMFNDAARVIVSNQQGSASLLQRKLKLGYNRAGRLIDQMEDAGIVGPFEGSKPRQVLISDLNSLETLLSGGQK
ncbi:MAG: DNA translocase FtsK [Cryomorphaceae bacterium]|jgi:S-DNA-T family DNA segregation ATPase FtsK/SpoIIIE|nr:DNA translocase FtsK [Cryomorphaceae bacterium]MBT3503646.1 DNA translocase FtsK [Cryomorphaceae bacterium]MBT3689276.1 DNA translocase FtsK [Cryomorphaceae bacterium]MBT4222106.1 DNA translocase FtsK [Cryomorphaceae bacterium]MBT4293659.1 DNA translocase FtsK [Cryomorphaceae bacterium]